MTNWAEIGECCEIISGSTPSRLKKEYWNGQIDWFTPKDLSDIEGKYVDEAPEKITEAGFNSCSTSMIPPYSLLFTSRAPIGHLAINKRTVCTNQGFKSLIPSKEIDVNYLFYAMKHFTPRLQELGNGATFKELSKATLSRFKIPVPPLPIQQKIAAILDAADALRQKDKLLLKKYEELGQAVFLEMFGDPVRNEKGWKFTSLTDLITEKPSNGFFAKAEHYNDHGTSIVWISDFIDRLYVKTDNLKKVDTKGNDSKYRLQYGDVLFCRSSLTPEGIGKCAVVPKTLPIELIFECHIIKLRLNSEVLVPEYFRFLSDTTYFRNNIIRNAKTSTMTTISQEGISSIEIPLPPFLLQKNFLKKLEVIEKQKSFAKESSGKSEELFNNLLQKVAICRA